jgi:hypothetical protein
MMLPGAVNSMLQLCRLPKESVSRTDQVPAKKPPRPD